MCVHALLDLAAAAHAKPANDFELGSVVRAHDHVGFVAIKHMTVAVANIHLIAMAREPLAQARDAQHLATAAQRTSCGACL